MKKLSIKLSYLFIAAEVAFLAGLPENGPTVKLSTTDARQLSNIYYRVFGASSRPTEIAMKGRWPGGERIKTIEAQRMVLSCLMDLQSAMKITDSQSHLIQLLATMQAGSELQIWMCGNALEVHTDLSAINTRTIDMVDIVCNGRIQQIVYLTAITHEYAFKLLFGSETPYHPNVPISFDYSQVPGHPIEDWIVLPSTSDEAVIDSSEALPGLIISGSLSTPAIPYPDHS